LELSEQSHYYPMGRNVNLTTTPVIDIPNG